MHTKILFHILLAFYLLLPGCTKHSGEPEKRTTQAVDQVNCPGFSFLDNEAASVITSPASGKLISVIPERGETVRQGQHVAVLENTEFISLQEEFLEARNMLEFYSQEYARQGDLTVENATSMRKMQVAKRDFQSAELKYNSLYKQLSVMGFLTDSLKSEKITSMLPVRSSRQGIITTVYAQPGSYVEKGEKLFDLAKTQRILLKIRLPEKWYTKVDKGQKMDFRLISDSVNVFQGTILSVGNEIDPESRTAELIAIPDSADLLLVPGMSVIASLHHR